MTLEALLQLCAGDRALVEMLIVEGLLPPPLERQYDDLEAEEIRVARLLVRDLEVNLAGVEVILHMRRETLALRRQIADILAQLQSLRRAG